MAKKEPNKAREYLEQVKMLDAHIFDLLEEKAEFVALREKITSSWGTERVSGGESRDRFNETTHKIIEIEKRINEKVDELVDKKVEIRRVIEQLDDPDQVKLLFKVYFRFATLEEAAVELGCCYRNACYIHGDALAAVSEILDKQK